MAREGRLAAKNSLRTQVLSIVFLCWLMPVLMILVIMARNLNEQVGRGAEANLSEQLAVHLRFSADRLSSAAEASRLASYDPTIRTAWLQYGQDQNYVNFYRSCRSFLNRQYQTDSRFLYSVFAQQGREPLITVNANSGLKHHAVEQFWAEDQAAAAALAENLDTALAWLAQDGRVYLIRNIVDGNYETIGTLSLCLNAPYYFEEIAALPWAGAVEAVIGSCRLPLKGVLEEGGRGLLHAEAKGTGFVMSAQAQMDYGVLLSQFYYYRFFLIGMLILLLLILPFALWFMNKRVTRPVAVLMEGAKEVEKGKFGFQLAYKPGSREFSYLIDSFNHMSARLKDQFERLYQEELALRDAQIKGLQAHINPHFLNNTMEIINWEARLNGAEKVSRMIEALSTVLDAVLARDRSPVVTLAEELSYVDAYLYIAKSRYGERLLTEIEVPEELKSRQVPRLILQPVVENAVEHGIRPGEVCHVRLKAQAEGEMLILEISNDGGLRPEDEAHIARLLADDYDPDTEKSGNIGIANVNTRLKLLCGEDCGLSIKAQDASKVTARLLLREPRP